MSATAAAAEIQDEAVAADADAAVDFTLQERRGNLIHLAQFRLQQQQKEA